MNASVTRRLLLWLAVPLTLLALLGGLVNYFIDVAPMLRNSDVRLSASARALAGQLRVADGQVTLLAAPTDASLRFVIRDALHRVVAGDARLPELTATSAGGYPLHATVHLDQRDMRSFTIRARTDAGPATVTVAEWLGTSEAQARFGFLSKLLLDVVQLIITLGLVWFGVRLGLQPLKDLRAALADRSPQDLRPLLETAVPQEILPLTTALNRLLATVRTTLQTQQQFMANTAHQLRTPIAGLSAQLDVLAHDPAAEPIRTRVSSLQEGIRQLAHTTQQLLTLARADAAAQRVGPKNSLVDLGKMCTEVVARFVDRAVQAGIDLGVEARPAALRVDPALMEDLLGNLVDNALKYTPAGGIVTVNVGLDGAKVVLEVDDSGRGIPEAERLRVRQRFYRSPEPPSHGTGLGLAIVDEIVRLYGATLHIGAGSSGQGTKVRILFPAGLRVET